MREKLNSNPVAQAAILGVLLLATGFFVFSSMGGGGEEEEGAAPSPESLVATAAAPAGPGVTAVPPSPAALADAAPPPPPAVTAAFAANRTVVLLFVRDGGIGDRLVLRATHSLGALPGVSTFVVPARRIARYAAIAGGVDLNRVPALVVLRPKRLDHGVPTASVTYGFQSPQNVLQAVVDAGYKGRTLGYHP
ncbi:MAG TPA: hypothetical protein VHI77_05905 [Solirubrobacterales bacterium]|jgi:hypothetical protein|nr:hypothetical protein [Solirubrobacterales bacterium]